MNRLCNVFRSIFTRKNVTMFYNTLVMNEHQYFDEFNILQFTVLIKIVNSEFSLCLKISKWLLPIMD